METSTTLKHAPSELTKHTGPAKPGVAHNPCATTALASVDTGCCWEHLHRDLPMVHAGNQHTGNKSAQASCRTGEQGSRPTVRGSPAQTCMGTEP